MQILKSRRALIRVFEALNFVLAKYSLKIQKIHVYRKQDFKNDRNFIFFWIINKGHYHKQTPAGKNKMISARFPSLDERKYIYTLFIFLPRMGN